MVLVEQVQNGMRTTQMTVKVGGDKVRTDISPMVSTITDASTGDVTTLLHAQKAYVFVSAATAKAMMAMAAQAMQQPGASPSGTPAPPQATGKTDKINGYNATEYVFTDGAMKASYWMSTDFPNAQAVNAALAKFRKGGLADVTRAFTPDMTKLPGVPVKTVVDMNGQKMVTELISASDETVDPSVYEVPASYTQMKMTGQ